MPSQDSATPTTASTPTRRCGGSRRSPSRCIAGRESMSGGSRIRSCWIRPAITGRRIGAAMGKAVGSACVTNVWIPDGMKDTPADRVGPRERLVESLNAVFAEALDPAFNLDAVEGKLFGLGCESYTVGSHEFYFGYAMSRRILYTLDTGHYHPTETITDRAARSARPGCGSVACGRGVPESSSG